MLAELRLKKERVHEEAKKLFADWKPTVSKMLETYLTLDPGFSDAQNYALFDSNLPIYLLGEKFMPKGDMGRIKKFMSSLLWFTYRKNFQPIGGTGPTTDQGWGCMLRCGQMLLARALVMRHLGRNWLWDQDIQLAEYKRILPHMGVSEGKEIGEWFGPNTAAQVLKKLVIYDQWSRLAVHVALDNVLITSDIRTMAFTRPPHRKSGSRHETGSDYNDNLDAIDPAEAEIPPESTRSPTRSETSSISSCGGVSEEWRPLLIIIPLRLGLNTINRCYFPAIQAFFQLPQCVGIIGGRPNHALYFCGIADNNLLYLDPHFCQDFVDLDETMTTRDQRDGYVEGLFIFQHLLPASTPPLFEMLETRPKNFPPFVPYVGETTKLRDYADLGEVNDSYDEFELLE
ncbi:unnamed protein product [Litomosoides sigmodontis]|uniref:Cysteine protease n=1 Tax=Litomosoides sigmodontis TaxID=42156 RepID=A0A3P6T2L9_LITSI|nr:unnamed protein product [Litomosoides sigmodontis]